MLVRRQPVPISFEVRMVNISIDKVARTFDLSNNDVAADQWLWEANSLMYNYHVVGRGVILNPDVCQMTTPAGLRAEHPIATIIGWCMNYAPAFENLQKLARHMVGVQGSFVFAATNSRRDKCVVVVRNLDARWSSVEEEIAQVKNELNQLWLLSVEADGRVDAINLPIAPSPVERRLFVVENFTDDWTIPWRRPNDYRISVAQIDYKSVRTHLDKGCSGPWYLNFVSRCLAFALDFPTANVPSAIVLGLKPEECDLLLISALTRAVYAATSGQIRLEVPLYEQSIGYRITETY